MKSMERYLLIKGTRDTESLAFTRVSIYPQILERHVLLIYLARIKLVSFPDPQHGGIFVNKNTKIFLTNAVHDEF